MELLKKILCSLDGRMEVPKAYGGYHFMWIGIILAFCVIFFFVGRKFQHKGRRTILAVFGILCVIFEIYKQLNYSYDCASDTWHYKWWAFPFQFCSIPIYLMLIASCLKKCKFQDMLFMFLATYSLIAGLTVLAMPSTVYNDKIGINIQTMFWHGSMIVVGVYLFASGAVVKSKKIFLECFVLFLALVFTALIFDIVMYKSGFLNGEPFNMFYLSPYMECNIFFLDLVFYNLPYPIFLFLYVVGFSIGAFIPLLIYILIGKYTKKTKKYHHA